MEMVAIFLVFIVNISTSPWPFSSRTHVGLYSVGRGWMHVTYPPSPLWAQIGHYLHSTLLGVTHNRLPISPTPKIPPLHTPFYHHFSYRNIYRYPLPHPPIYHQILKRSLKVLGFISKTVSFVLAKLTFQFENDQTVFG